LVIAQQTNVRYNINKQEKTNQEREAIVPNKKAEIVDAEDEQMEKQIIRTEEEHIPIGSFMKLPDGDVEVEIVHKRRCRVIKDKFSLMWLIKKCGLTLDRA
jgi:hypothetical protein